MLLKKAGYELKDGTMLGPDGKPLRPSRSCSTARPGAPSPAPGSARWRSSASPSPSAPSTAPSIRSASSVYDFDAMLMTLHLVAVARHRAAFRRWGSASRDADGTFNFAGVADPAVDATIEHR